jgi:glycosyltransferase involved in cell wall biosynthesis
MYYGLPIVATDFTFNRDVLADSALYYKPKDPRSAASQFAEILQNDQLQKEFKKRMKGRLELYNDYDSHFDSIVSFLKKVITRAL